MGLGRRRYRKERTEKLREGGYRGKHGLKKGLRRKGLRKKGRVNVEEEG